MQTIIVVPKTTSVLGYRRLLGDHILQSVPSFQYGTTGPKAILNVTFIFEGRQWKLPFVLSSLVSKNNNCIKAATCFHLPEQDLKLLTRMDASISKTIKDVYEVCELPLYGIDDDMLLLYFEVWQKDNSIMLVYSHTKIGSSMAPLTFKSATVTYIDGPLQFDQELKLYYDGEGKPIENSPAWENEYEEPAKWTDKDDEDKDFICDDDIETSEDSDSITIWADYDSIFDEDDEDEL